MTTPGKCPARAYTGRIISFDVDQVLSDGSEGPLDGPIPVRARWSCCSSRMPMIHWCY
jgi:hypothetical protein